MDLEYVISEVYVHMIRSVHTQELSETDITLGANVDVGIFGVLVPLMEGVFEPYVDGD